MAKKDKKNGKDKDTPTPVSAASAPESKGKDPEGGKGATGKAPHGKGPETTSAGAAPEPPAAPTWSDLVADPIPHADAAPPVSTSASPSVAALGSPVGPTASAAIDDVPPDPAPLEITSSGIPVPVGPAAGGGSPLAALDAPPPAPVSSVPSIPAGWGTDDVADALLLPLRVVRRVLPTRRTPVFLGVAALAVVGAIDWPVAVGAGLGWEALRRWGANEQTSRPGR